MTYSWLTNNKAMGFKQNVQEITTKIQKQTNSKDILIFQLQTKDGLLKSK